MASKKKTKKRRANDTGSVHKYPNGSSKWFVAERIARKLTVKSAPSEQSARKRL